MLRQDRGEAFYIYIYPVIISFNNCGMLRICISAIYCLQTLHFMRQSRRLPIQRHGGFFQRLVNLLVLPRPTLHSLYGPHRCADSLVYVETAVVYICAPCINTDHFHSHDHGDSSFSRGNPGSLVSDRLRTRLNVNEPLHVM